MCFFCHPSCSIHPILCCVGTNTICKFLIGFFKKNKKAETSNSQCCFRELPDQKPEKHLLCMNKRKWTRNVRNEMIEDRIKQNAKYVTNSNNGHEIRFWLLHRARVLCRSPVHTTDDGPLEQAKRAWHIFFHHAQFSSEKKPQLQFTIAALTFAFIIIIVSILG